MKFQQYIFIIGMTCGFYLRPESYKAHNYILKHDASKTGDKENMGSNGAKMEKWERS